MRALLLSVLLASLFACGSHAPPRLPSQVALAQERDEPAPEFGGSVHVIEAGSPTAPPLMLIHGLGPGSSDFHALLPTLSAHYHVLTFDLPGFGLSTHDKQLYTPERYAHFLHAMAARHFRAPAAVFGHSMGGAIAIAYAASYPQEVAKLALLDVAGLIHYRAYSRMVIGSTPAHHSLWERTRRSINGVLFDVGMYPLGGLDLQTLELSDRSLLSHALPSEQLAAIAFIKHDFGPALHAVSAPVWLGWGKLDTVAPLRTFDALRYALRPIDSTLFTSSAHNPMRSEPQAVLDALQRFLTATPSAALVSIHESTRYGLCDNAIGPIFEGDFDTIDIRDCKDAVLRDVRVRRLRVERSTVELTRVNIQGSDVALSAQGSRLAWTGGRAQAPVCLDSAGSQLDFMAVDLECPTALRIRKPSQLQSSISRMPTLQGYSSLHGEYELPRNFEVPLPALAIDAVAASAAYRGRADLMLDTKAATSAP